MSYEDEPIFRNFHEEEPPNETEQPRRPRKRSFRQWRRSRPFWGGLFSLLGGVEIGLIPLTAYRVILVSHSVALAAVVGAIIAILGALMWATPSQNKLYGLLVVLLGVTSFVTSNVGGFLLGGILAIIGGALGFAWVLVPPAAQASAVSPVEEAPDPGSEPEATGP